MSENARALERELDWLATVLDEVRLSVIGSKYIGETEENLARVFEEAERAGSILVFDEADALFGRRTGVNDTQDRFANQEVGFLLQRLEEFAGPVILASNLRVSMDEAFLRHIESVVAFPVPHRPRRGGQILRVRAVCMCAHGEHGARCCVCAQCVDGVRHASRGRSQ